MSCCTACAASLDGLSIVETEFGPRFAEATEPRGDGAYLALARARLDAETRALAMAADPNGPPACADISPHCRRDAVVTPNGPPACADVRREEPERESLDVIRDERLPRGVTPATLQG